jgi:hypothetical protein
VVEHAPTGMGYAWWIDQPRVALDPTHLALAWYDYERSEYLYIPLDDELLQRALFDDMLPRFRTSARILAPSSGQLAELSDAIKRESVLVMQPWGGGCLSRYWWDAELGSAPDPARDIGCGSS